MARIGFIGLGVMGLPMATKLISAGQGHGLQPQPRALLTDAARDAGVALPLVVGQAETADEPS